MMLTVVPQMASLTERHQVHLVAVRRVVVEVRDGEHHHPVVDAGGASVLVDAPGGAGEAAADAVTLAAASGAVEADGVADLPPVLRVGVPGLRADGGHLNPRRWASSPPGMSRRPAGLKTVAAPNFNRSVAAQTRASSRSGDSLASGVQVVCWSSNCGKLPTWWPRPCS